MTDENSRKDDPKGEHRPEHTVTVVVDDRKHNVRPGQWLVRDFKAAVGVDAAKVLAEITPHGITDLDDNGHIEIREGQRFMSHARSGAAS